jgi:mycofactocin precursor
MLALSATRLEVSMAEKLTVPAATAEHDEAEPLATEELLVEEVSIDGMCGVY